MAGDLKPSDFFMDFDAAQTTIVYSMNYARRNYNVTVTANDTSVNKWVGKVMYSVNKEGVEPLFGLDTEWCIVNRQRTKVKVVQICYNNLVLVYQIAQATTIPTSFRQFINAKGHRWAGVAVCDDLQKLEVDYGFKPRGKVNDLRDVAYRAHDDDKYLKYGLARLANEFLGSCMHKDKRVTMSNWGRSCLTYQQMRYAAEDAYLSYHVYKAIFNARTIL